jgi:hypothetical protein
MQKSLQTIGQYVAAAAIIAVALDPALAQAGGFTPGFAAKGSGTNLREQITQMAVQTSGMPALISWFGYIIGTAFTAFGIFKLKAHADNAAQNKLGPALGLLFTGAAFLVLPGAAALLTATQSLDANAQIVYAADGFK